VKKTTKLLVYSITLFLIFCLAIWVLVFKLPAQSLFNDEHHTQNTSTTSDSYSYNYDEVLDSQINSLDSEQESSESFDNNTGDYSNLQDSNEDEPLIRLEDFSFANGVVGLEELTEVLSAKVETLSGQYSIYVKCLDTNEYLLINHRRQTPASLIKLFNVVYAFERIENGNLEKTPLLEQWLNQAIVVSCNNANNHLLATFGYGNLVQGAMNSTYFAHSQGFEDTIIGGSLYPSYFEIVGFSNLYTSALDVGHLLENIYRGTMINERASQQILDILLAQQRLHKIPAGLPDGTITASKTGEIGPYDHDAAIVFTENNTYIIIIMTENASFAINNIQELSRIVYDHFNSR
jgi:beta-lactamase class A